MTVIASAEVLIVPVTQQFAKQLDTQVQTAVANTSRKANLNVTAVDKGGTVANLDKSLQGVSKSGTLAGTALTDLSIVSGTKLETALVGVGNEGNKAGTKLKGMGTALNTVSLGGKSSAKELANLGTKGASLESALSGVAKSGTVTGTVLGKLGATGGTLGQLLGGALPTAALAGAAAITAFAVKGIHDFLSLADSVRQFQIISGASAEDASKLVAVTNALGVSSQSAGTGVFFLEKNLDKTTPKLAALGVNVVKTKDGNLDLSATFLNVADAISRTEDPAKRAEIAFAAFGRGGKALLPVLEQGRQGIQALIDEAQKSGQIINQKQVDAAFKFRVELHHLGQEAGSFGRSVGAIAVPALAELSHLLSLGIDDIRGFAGEFGKLFRDPLGVFKDIGHALSPFPPSAKSAGDSAKDLHNKLVAVNIEMGVLAHTPNVTGPQLQKLADDLTGAGFGAEQAAGLIDSVTTASEKLGAQATATVNQLNALGPGITHAFGDTKHQVLEWQKTLNQSLNFVAQDLGNIASSLDQTTKASSAAVDAASKSSISAQNRVQLAQDRLNVFQAKLSAQSQVSAQDLAKETLLQDQLSQAKDRAGTASENLAKAQSKDADAAKQVLKAFDTNIQQMVIYRQNFDKLLARNAPADLVKQLTDLGQSGASIVSALANANGAQFDKIVRDWRRARDQAPGVSQDIRHAFIKDGPIKIPVFPGIDVPHTKKTIADFRLEMRDALEGGLPVTAKPKVTTPNVDITATNVTISGKFKAAAFGGFLGAGEPSLVGEKGPELFVPQTAGTIVPNSKLGGFTSQDVDRIIQAIERAIQLSRPITVNEVAQSPVATAESVAARLGLAGVR